MKSLERSEKSIPFVDNCNSRILNVLVPPWYTLFFNCIIVKNPVVSLVYELNIDW
jgi:hypothetical protein